MKKRIKRTSNKAKQKRTRQKLEQKLKRTMGENLEGIVYDVPGEISMSEALENVIGLFMDEVETLEAAQNVVGLGALAWNLALRPSEEVKNELSKLVKGMAVEPGDAQMLTEIINEMIERKRKLYPDVDRYIVNFEVEDRGNTWYLSVASTFSPEE